MRKFYPKNKIFNLEIKIYLFKFNSKADLKFGVNMSQSIKTIKKTERLTQHKQEVNNGRRHFVSKNSTRHLVTLTLKSTCSPAKKGH